MTTILANPLVRRIAREVLVTIAGWLIGIAIVHVGARVERFLRPHGIRLIERVNDWAERRRRAKRTTTTSGPFSHPVPEEPTALVVA